MPKVIPGRVTWLSPLPRGRRTTPNYSRRARMLLIKQINDLDFFTVRPTLPLPPLPGCQFFMSFRGPKAHHNRSHTSDSRPPQYWPPQYLTGAWARRIRLLRQLVKMLIGS